MITITITYCICRGYLKWLTHKTHRNKPKKDPNYSQHVHFFLLFMDVSSNALFLSCSKCSFSLDNRSWASVVCACSTLSPDNALISENRACNSCGGKSKEVLHGNTSRQFSSWEQLPHACRYCTLTSLALYLVTYQGKLATIFWCHFSFIVLISFVSYQHHYWWLLPQGSLYI